MPPPDNETIASQLERTGALREAPPPRPPWQMQLPLRLSEPLADAAKPKRRPPARLAKFPAPAGEINRPSVEQLLDVDDEYLRRAEANELPRIAPRRFNPEGKPWLPVLRTRRQEWSMVALFSNTGRAHELAKTHDWVIIYCRRSGLETQNTVVTAGAGALKGLRIVRGREAECRELYGL
jgi:hypothetical protein